MAILDQVASEWAYIRGAYGALRGTVPIGRNPGRTARELFEDLAQRFGERLALFSGTERLTFAGLDARANRYARWAQSIGVRRGDVVGLLMPNRPEFLAIWLGVAKAGGVTALLNTHLTGASLAHCVNCTGAKALIVDAALLDQFESARPRLAACPPLFIHGEAMTGVNARIDRIVEGFPGERLTGAARVPLTINDRCLFIFTSGATGLPKAANVNHYRVQLAMQGFAGLTGARAGDRMYDCLPMYHSAGGLCATGAVLSVGGSCFIRDKFSARDFWPEIIEHDCTMFAYIGELCRYLLAAPSSPVDRGHKIRLCFGNGLRPDIFEAFRDRVALPQILEFYAATEGNITIFNFDSKPGAVGRIPCWLEHRFPIKLVRYDVEIGMPARGPDGRCIECAPGEPGEAIGKIVNDPARPANRFDGYADPQMTGVKILRDVFAPGDAWFRSGDLMRKDARGYFYFIDRIGDTFRWKGENVSTTEVSEVVSAFPGVREANVYGVQAPGFEGRAGMAALVVEDEARFDLAGFRAWLAAHLPPYAQPLFLRFQRELDVTATFKPMKYKLVEQGFDPQGIDDPLYFNDPRAGAFVRIDRALFSELARGAIRL